LDSDTAQEIKRRLQQLKNILVKFEEKLDLCDDPKKEVFYENEIAKTKQRIEEVKKELLNLS